jgi:hypothetical protein
MTIVENANERAAWLLDAARVRVMLQGLETQISAALGQHLTFTQMQRLLSAALGQHLTFTQMQRLLSADQHLGQAARAITAATNEIKRI